jgi:uncharacterized protein (DUF1697 family)
VKARVALLRSVNVGGTGKLPMEELRAMCAECGLDHVRTHIASGNVVFASAMEEAVVKEKLETRIEHYVGRRIAVLVRDAAEMAAVLTSNPFADANPSQTVAIFLDAPPAPDTIEQARGRTVERIALGRREIYVDYAGSMGTSKLSLAASKSGTARNMNTVARMAELVAELEAVLRG